MWFFEVARLSTRTFDFLKADRTIKPRSDFDTSFNIPLTRKVNIIMSMKFMSVISRFSRRATISKSFLLRLGAVESATVVEDRETGRSRGFGFVEMANQEDGEKAITELDGTEFSGREIKVNEAKPREDGGGRVGAGRQDRW